MCGGNGASYRYGMIRIRRGPTDKKEAKEMLVSVGLDYDDVHHQRLAPSNQMKITHRSSLRSGP